jgi:hypothetical protein
MITLQIVDGSLQVSNNGSIILVAPKNSCAIDVLSLYDAIPLAVIYNKYLGTSTNIFTQPLANCENSVGTPFTVNSFIAFAEANLGFDTVGGGCGGSPFEYNANATGIQPILGTNDASGSYSTIGGGSCNTASVGCFSTIGGGNYNLAQNSYSVIGGGLYNCSLANFSTVSGGRNNLAFRVGSNISGGYYNCACGDISTVGGGCCNNSYGQFSTIGGGKCNYSNGNHSIVGGGYENKIIGSGNNSTIGGGKGNCICSQGSVIAGGGSYGAINNIISVYSNFSSILGGFQNTASAYYSTIGGGKTNIASGNLSFIGGGELNSASGIGTTIGGGKLNTSSGLYSTIGGGYCNTVRSIKSFIGGGYNNYIKTSATDSAILGGYNNNTDSYCSTFIIGNNITANRVNTTFVNNLSIMQIPTSSAGLPSKSVWSDLGILTIVP